MMKTRKLSKTAKKDYLTYAVVLAAFIVMQILSSTGSLSSTLKGQLVPICAYVIMALSLNLTVGVLGELSLGHAGFMSIGAFTGTVIASALNGSGIPDTWILIIALTSGALLAAIVGLLIGIPVLRLNGDYLAIVTLAFGEIIKSLVNNLYIGIDANGLHASFLKNTIELQTGGRMILSGAMGVPGIRKLSTFLAGAILILLSLFIIFHLVRSRAGRAIMAIRDNRIAVESVGINITTYKMMAFVISAAIAGVGGALFGLGQNTIIASKFDFNASILILVFVVLGGQGNMLGSIIAALITGYGSNMFLNLSLFFAYAALYPDEQVLLFMFLPIKMKYLALADAALYLYYFIVGGASTRVTIVLCLLNVFLFLGGDIINTIRRESRYWKTRYNFRKAMRK